MPKHLTGLSIRCPKNKHEAQFWDFCLREGIQITKRGWPDFLCFHPDGRLIAVEVKPPGYKLKKSQLLVLQALATYGIECYRWTGDGVFERVNGKRWWKTLHAKAA